MDSSIGLLESTLAALNAATAATTAALAAARDNSSVHAPARAITGWEADWARYADAPVAGTVVAAWTVHGEKTKDIILLTAEGVVYVCMVKSLLSRVVEEGDWVSSWKYTGASLTAEILTVVSSLMATNTFGSTCSIDSKLVGGNSRTNTIVGLARAFARAGAAPAEHL